MTFDPDQEIHVAEIVEASPVIAPDIFAAKRKRSCLIPILIVLGLSLAILVGGAMLIYKAIAPNVVTQTDEESKIERSEEFRLARTAFEEHKTPTDHPDYERICQLIERVADAADDEVNPAIQDCIDYQRTAKEMRQYPELNTLAYFGNAVVAATVRQLAVGPIPFSEFTVYSIEDIAADERKVTLQTSGVYEGTSPCVWWVIRSANGQWKLYDWNPLEYGMRDSRENAILLGEQNDANTRAYNRYVTILMEYLNEPEQTEQVKLQLLSCKDQTYNKLIADTTNLNIAMHLESNGDLEESQQFLDLIPDKTQIPGAIRLLAQIQFQEQKFELAKQNFEKYLSILGPEDVVLESLIQIHSLNHERGKELAVRRQAIPYIKNDYSANLAAVFLIESKENLPALLAEIDELEESEARYSELVQQLGDNPFVTDRLEMIADHLADSEFDEGVAVQARSQIAFAQNDVERGLELLRNGLQADDPDDQYVFWSRVIELNKAVEFFKAEENKEPAFETIAEIYGEYGFQVSDKDFLEIANIALKEFPKSARTLHAAGSAAYDQSDYPTAIKHLTEAKQLFDGEADEYVVSYNSELLAYSLFNVGDRKEAEAIAKESSNESMLIQFASYKKKISEIEGLIDALEDEPDNKKFYLAKLAMEKGNNANAKSLLVELVNEQEPSEYGYGDSYRFGMALIDCCNVAGDVLDAYRETRKTDVFQWLTSRLVKDEDWDRANELAALGRQEVSSSTQSELELAAVVELEHQILWAHGDMKSLASTANFERDIAAFTPEAQSQYNSLEFVFRAAIRTGNKELAKRAAEMCAKLDYPGENVALLWAAHSNDAVGFKKLQATTYYDKELVFRDPDFPKLDIAQLKELTGKGARTLATNSRYDANVLTVLFDRDPNFKKSDVEALAAAVFSNAATVVEMDDQYGGLPGWIVRHDASIVTVVQSTRRSKPVISSEEVSKELRSAFDDYAHKIVFEIDSDDWQSPAPNRMLLEIVGNLKFEHATAIASDNQWQIWSEGLATFEQIKKKTMSWSEFEETAPIQYLAEDEPATKNRAEFQNSFANAYRELQATNVSDKHLIVSVRVYEGSLTETVRIDVSEIAFQAWSQNDVYGKLLDDCKFDPTLKSGDVVVVTSSEVFRWQLNVGGLESSNEF